jgi:hypothetical protein
MESSDAILQRKKHDFPNIYRRSNKATREVEKMAARLFDEILAKGIRSGQLPSRSSTAREWFRDKAKSLGKVTETRILRDDTDRLKNRVTVGKMYFFMYDAKHKDTLPYYDKFPLIFPVDKTPNGFYGINTHYLPLPLRAQLMDALYDITNNNRYDESTKLKMSYSVLKGAEKFKLFKPTFKRYLTSQVRSRFVQIEPAEWDIALFLQAEQFVGASKTKVWADSRKIIRG